MFLPFLIAFLVSISLILKQRKISYILLLILFIITILLFKYHATNNINLSF
ncbi:MAG: DUF5993 family protein [Candidatus Liberibacter asiaticus]|uniref:DUF5993 family protein n=1 Tax=Liberibacter asiaticus TaxID=34021 RepID=UPI00030B9211|nr:hypothetical protein FXW22_01055 [Candidatus Liberibacter asiaticus]KAE9511219.1 hypothetical protein FXW31_02615 [Candidatus Liberibacter asiaticus]KAE9512578.1 hypothetical protein FXW32_00915 [Candidatus Liberibacter asiaticus]KAE9513659.1 hypothetical protein FXW35_01115 [Candidatus Liberibacter asiaticus]KAE9514732.1 hypothetical protein FXW25_01010 [Candidatus Liberibacter asiaticus]